MIKPWLTSLTPILHYTEPVWPSRLLLLGKSSNLWPLQQLTASRYITAIIRVLQLTGHHFESKHVTRLMFRYILVSAALISHLHLVPSLKIHGRFISRPPYIFVAWCLIMHRDNFTLPLYVCISKVAWRAWITAIRKHLIQHNIHLRQLKSSSLKADA
jgi:hypothetical protein